MVDWNKIKCTQCKSFKKCRRENISKGSNLCQIRKKIIPPRKQEKGISKDTAGRAMLWSLLRGKKKE